MPEISTGHRFRMHNGQESTMVDAADLKEDGLDMEQMQIVIDRAMTGMHGCTSKEAKALGNMLESLRDDCEMYE